MLPEWSALFAAIPAWRSLEAALTEPSIAHHGDYARWRAALESLPGLHPEAFELGATVTVRGAASDGERDALRAALEGLHPWRKGPWSLFGVHIDSEWRSDWKWQRLLPALANMTDERVLDVGCGNGYFGWRALQAGAELVVGVDPSVLFFMQHLAVCRYLRSGRNWLLPLKFEALPPATFDTVMSMGVVYHRRNPVDHVRRLASFARPGGRLVLESLVVEGGRDLQVADRYARMRNVHVIPAVDTLRRWLEEAGLGAVQVVDVSRTTLDEQRSTPWMRFESLAEALDPADPMRTVEGHPAPVRAVVIGHR